MHMAQSAQEVHKSRPHFSAPPTSMLHIRMISGEELTSMPVEEVSSVRDVKRRLQGLHGLPPRFRQRLLLQGSNRKLDDADEVASPLDLQLVVLSFSSPSPTQVDQLMAASSWGSVREADVLRVMVLRHIWI